MKQSLVIIYGPTASGKSDLACQLAAMISGEIINADVGQFYTPLSIGTAKPRWQEHSIPHHLFDILDTPTDLTVTKYRSLVSSLLEPIWQRGNVPIVVGGSGFYIMSLLFAPSDLIQLPSPEIQKSQDSLWEKLYAVDPERAEQIHKHDKYRLQRALAVWLSSGVKPSLQKPQYEPLAPYSLFFLERKRDILYQRINERVVEMLNQGWIQEVESLDPAWYSFLATKKLIGYNAIITYLQGERTAQDYDQLCATIAQKTRNYAKRQVTFWRMLKKKLEPLARAYDSVQECDMSDNNSLELMIQKIRER
ncbi:MAG: tRNA (adenosine(37)-N6)-dimethylallyltransferase MiaA [Candidatus Babeliales bacterium]